MSIQKDYFSRYFSLLDQIKGIALEGLKYAKDPYDQARYQKLLDMTVQGYSASLNCDPQVLLEKFRGQIGIVTPKIGVEAVIFNQDGKLLVLKRSDEDTWCLPSGWMDVGEAPAQTAVRECKEETGLDLKAVKYLMVTHKGPHIGTHIYHQVNITTLMATVSNNVPIVLSHEHTDYQWVEPDQKLTWHTGHEKIVQHIFELAKQTKDPCLQSYKEGIDIEKNENHSELF